MPASRQAVKDKDKRDWTGRDRGEQVVWAKERALAILDKGNPSLALASLYADLEDHPDTKDPAIELGRMLAQMEQMGDIRRWIDGFN